MFKWYTQEQLVQNNYQMLGSSVVIMELRIRRIAAPRTKKNTHLKELVNREKPKI